MNSLDKSDYLEGMPKSGFSPFLKPIKDNRYNYIKKEVEGLYRPVLDVKQYPRELSLIYMFDNVINLRKRNKGTWYNKKILYQNWDNFHELNKLLEYYDIRPSNFLSNLFWMAENKQYPATYNRKLGYYIPDTTMWGKVLDNMSGYRKSVFFNSLNKFTLISGWEDVYFEESFNINTYDENISLFVNRMTSLNDYKMFDRIPKRSLNDDEKKYILLYLWNYSDSMSIISDYYRDLSGIYDSSKQETLLGYILGYHINLDKINLKSIEEDINGRNS